jgi:hypothetical protein
MIKGGVAWDPYPDPEGRGDDLEHVSEITFKVVLPVIKIRLCVDCGDRFRARDLFDVPEDHLTFFGVQGLCRECALKHGVL